jgi:hypothetical protein
MGRMHILNKNYNIFMLNELKMVNLSLLMQSFSYNNVLLSYINFYLLTIIFSKSIV